MSNITKVYLTRDTQQKLLSEAMAATKSKTTKKRKLRSSSMIEEEDNPSDKLVDVDEEEGDNITESNEELYLSQTKYWDN